MNKLNLLIGILIGLTILTCSSSDDGNTIPNETDPIIGVWNQIRVIDELPDGSTFISNSDSCEMMNTQVFDQNQNYSFRFFDNEFSDCQLAQESVTGSWSRTDDFYDLDFTFRNVISGEVFDGNEDIEFVSREISIQNDILRFRFIFSNETTTVEFVKQ